MSKHTYTELKELVDIYAAETDALRSKWYELERTVDASLPKTSRERFEEWKSHHTFRLAEHIHAVAWAAWQEAERQAKGGE